MAGLTSFSWRAWAGSGPSRSVPNRPAQVTANVNPAAAIFQRIVMIGVLFPGKGAVRCYGRRRRGRSPPHVRVDSVLFAEGLQTLEDAFQPVVVLVRRVVQRPRVVGLARVRLEGRLQP